jgi:Immunity protein 8
MKVRAKAFYSIETEDLLESYRPADINHFGTWIRVSIGTVDTDAADDFQIFICTPTWLDSYVENEKDCAVWGRHMLIVREYNLERIKASVARLVSRCSGNDWATVAEKLGRYAAWEFEDYQE